MSNTKINESILAQAESSIAAEDTNSHVTTIVCDGENNLPQLKEICAKTTVSPQPLIDDKTNLFNTNGLLQNNLLFKPSSDPKLVAECKKIYGDKDKTALRPMIDEFTTARYGGSDDFSLFDSAVYHGLNHETNLQTTNQKLPRVHLCTRPSLLSQKPKEEKQIMEKPIKEKTIDEMLVFIERCMGQLVSTADTTSDPWISNLYILLLRAGMLLERRVTYSTFQRKALFNMLEKTIECFQNMTVASLDQNMLTKTIEFYEQMK